ncbi:MAG: hypothetical protein NUV73_03605 [Candidatus Daviesbacteria bacterium]|nr:hypothetical protein [Candidatus Daviesbacteria bacterium]
MAEIVFNTQTPVQTGPKDGGDLESQVQNLQTTLASLNQQVIVLQETLQERDQKIADLHKQLADNLIVTGSQASPCMAKPKKNDETLTIVGGLIKLYKFFLPGKVI